MNLKIIILNERSQREYIYVYKILENANYFDDRKKLVVAWDGIKDGWIIMGYKDIFGGDEYV